MAANKFKSNDSFFTKPSQKGYTFKKKSSNSFVQSTIDTEEKQTTKKPFDKKKWRLEKYSMKHKVQNWEERRKKIILRDYHKQNKHNKQTNFDVNKIYEQAEAEQNEDNASDDDLPITKPKRNQFLSKAEEREERRKEYEKNKAEKELARKEYKKKKIEKFKRLNRKTKRGQPIMKERLQDLLEKIEASVADSNQN